MNIPLSYHSCSDVAYNIIVKRITEARKTGEVRVSIPFEEFLNQNLQVDCIWGGIKRLKSERWMVKEHKVDAANSMVEIIVYIPPLM